MLFFERKSSIQSLLYSTFHLIHFILLSKSTFYKSDFPSFKKEFDSICRRKYFLTTGSGEHSCGKLQYRLPQKILFLSVSYDTFSGKSCVFTFCCFSVVRRRPTYPSINTSKLIRVTQNFLRFPNLKNKNEGEFVP